jgi:hypothetical protein
MHADAITTLSGERVVKISLAGALTLVDIDTALSFAVEILEAVRRIAPVDNSDCNPRCKWVLHDEDANVWQPSCCEWLFSFASGTPVENNLSFCPYCGRKLEL